MLIYLSPKFMILQYLIIKDFKLVKHNKQQMIQSKKRFPKEMLKK